MHQTAPGFRDIAVPSRRDVFKAVHPVAKRLLQFRARARLMALCNRPVAYQLSQCTVSHSTFAMDFHGPRKEICAKVGDAADQAAD
jgi:hypothetical protein